MKQTSAVSAQQKKTVISEDSAVRPRKCTVFVVKVSNFVRST